MSQKEEPMNIAICDDNTAEQHSLAECINKILEERKIKSTTVLFSSGEELLRSRRVNSFSVYFLDIYMDHVSGIQAAYTIRERNPDAVIIFVTSSPDHMGEGFDVGAVHYLLKPITKTAVEQAIDRALRLTHEQERYITLTVDRTPRRVLLSEILVVESRDKSCIITTKTDTLRSYIRLNELEKMLDDNRFLRCHRSYLINMDHASGVIGNDFKMTNKVLVPIKRDHRLAMKKLFQDYCFEKLRKGMK